MWTAESCVCDATVGFVREMVVATDVHKFS